MSDYLPRKIGVKIYFEHRFNVTHYNKQAIIVTEEWHWLKFSKRRQEAFSGVVKVLHEQVFLNDWDHLGVEALVGLIPVGTQVDLPAFKGSIP